MSDIRVTARLSDGIHATAQIANVVKEPADAYTGEYTVTAPTTDDLVLPTKDKLMADDLTIRQSAEIYTGETTISVKDSDVVLNTENKLMPSNVTLKQGFPRYNGPYSLTLSNSGTHNFLVKGRYCDQNIQVVQPYVRYNGPYYFEVEDESVNILLANEVVQGMLIVDISAVEALANQISEVVG